MLAVLTLSFQVFFKPLPYPEVHNLVKIDYQRFDDSGTLQSITYPYPGAQNLYNDQKSNQYLADLAMVRYSSDIIASLGHQPKVNSLYVSHEWFALFGATMQKGAAFNAERGVGTNNPGIIISNQLWHDEFAGNQDILEESISLNGVQHPIVGVMSKDFEEPQFFEVGRHTQVWLPWDFNNSEYQEQWELPDNNVMLFGTSNVDSAAKLELQKFLTKAQLDFAEGSQDFGEYSQWRMGLEAVPVTEKLLGYYSSTMIVLLVSAAGILLIAMANITNLFFARTLEMRKQLALRAAVGAKSSQVQHVILGETIVIMATSCLIAFVVATGIFSIVENYLTSYIPRSESLRLDIYVVICGIIISAMFCVILANTCSRLVNYDALNVSLSSSGKGTSKQVSKKARNLLIGAQVCISIVLIFVSIVLSVNAYKFINKKLQLDSNSVVSMEFTVATINWEEWDSYVAKITQLRETLLNQPGIDSVSFGRSPIDDVHQFPIKDAETKREHFVYHRNIDDKYFDVTGHKLLFGRGFIKDDIKPTSDVILVNQTFAVQIAKKANEAVGKSILFGDTPLRVVGVVQDMDIPGVKIVPPRIYIPNNGAGLWMLIRFDGTLQLSRDKMIALLQEADPQFVVTKFQVLGDILESLRLPYQIVIVSSLCLSLFTVLLSCVGLFGLMSYNITMREVEISVRMSVGAKHKDIKKMLIKSSFGSFMVGGFISIVFIAITLFIPSLNLRGFVSIGLLSAYMFSIFIVLLILTSATLFPLSKLLKKPLREGLVGG